MFAPHRASEHVELPTRVVIVTDSLSVDGGSSKVALVLARGLAERGIATTVFAASGADADEIPNLSCVTTGQGPILGDADVAGAAARGLYNFTARDMLARLLATCDRASTVVHVHSWTKALSASIFDAILASRIPAVTTLHEYFIACPTGSLYLHRRAEICRLKPMGGACVTTNCDSRSFVHKAYRVARQFVQRDIVRVPARLNNLITVSNFSRTVLSGMLPANKQIRVVRNPVDIERGPRATAETNRPFVYAGRLSPEKGATLFAEAARRANVEAVFVGDGDDREKIRRANPDARIIGWVEPSHVVDYLRGARTVVLPSLWYETLGLVVLEGAALGIPAIVPQGTAPSDSVIDGISGSWFARGDVDDLADKLRLHKDDATIAHMSRQAYDRYWIDPPTLANHIAEMLSVYATARDNFLATERT